MKKYIFILIVITTAFASCKKDKINNSIYGTWELKSVSGGLSPDRAVATGNGNTYQFNSNNTYVKFENNKEVARGNFHITIDEVSRGYEFGTIYFTNPDYRDAWRYSPGNISIGSSAADGPSYNYVKIK